ncbi:MAG: lipopolysaccharide biosynthesis protein [Candidatus Staskawiczbacteria bacterium]|nr:lipopolysaccharide biosynthesis protein [Candidatus Staskawiczbacteria bacterium]
MKNLIKKFFSREGSISKKTIQGTFWLFAFRIVDQFFSFIQAIILAHIISPEDFGLFGVAFIAVSVLESFSQTGIDQAIIQKKDSAESYLDTAWIIQIARGIILATILILIAPFVASVFNAPQAALIAQFVALSILIQGFVNIGIIYFGKDLEFDRYFIYQLFGTAIEFIAVVSAALVFRNVWALVIGLIVGNLVRLVASYALHSYRPHFKFDYKKAKEMFNFGKWIFWSNVLNFFLLQADSIFVGRFLGVLSLGFYQVGYKISSITSASIVSGAIFPAYSKIQHDIKKMAGAYLKTIKFLLFIFAPISSGIIVIASEFTFLFLGRQWLPAVTPMRLLCLAGLVSIFDAASSPVLKALGQPKIQTKYSAVQLAVFLILLYPLIKMWGISGAALAVLTSAVVYVSCIAITTISIIKCRWFDFLKETFIPLANCAFMVLFVSFMKNFVGNNFAGFFILVISGIASYFFFVFISDKFLNYKIYSAIKESFLVLVA